MGFNSWISHLLLASQKERSFDSEGSIGLGGRQTVFLTVEDLTLLAHSYGVPENRLQKLLKNPDIDADTLRTKGGISDSAFIESLLGMKTVTFDATDYENASQVLDLNVSFSQQNATHLLGSLNAVFDGGCLDNVFDPAMAIKNLSSLLSPGGRIFNWVCASNWPGAYSMISPEWLFSFYAINRFRKIRIYIFVPQVDDSSWPNLTAAVFRYNPFYTRSATWDPWKAMQDHPGHPCFVLGVAECHSHTSPDNWLVPMQSHYLTKELFDWREEHETAEDLLFNYSETGPGADLYTGPYGSDHFKFKGLIRGFPSSTD